MMIVADDYFYFMHEARCMEDQMKRDLANKNYLAITNKKSKRSNFSKNGRR